MTSNYLTTRWAAWKQKRAAYQLLDATYRDLEHRNLSIVEASRYLQEATTSPHRSMALWALYRATKRETQVLEAQFADRRVEWRSA